MSNMFDFCGRSLNLGRPQVMGVLNVTPDSFSDGGCYQMLDSALRQAEKMVADGAAIVDVGGESTRPGAEKVSVQEELDRVVPVIERIARDLDVVISVDTSTPSVMKAAVDAGASLINDVRALGRPGAEDMCVELGVPVCLMHMQGQPRNMQNRPEYSDVVGEVLEYLRQRKQALVDKGLSSNKIMVDPGFGFGKTVHHNYLLLDRLESFVELKSPLLVGMSRKSMIGAVTDRSVDERLSGSIAAAVIAAMKGASIIRVHDVKETVDAVKVVMALRESR